MLEVTSKELAYLKSAGLVSRQTSASNIIQVRICASFGSAVPCA